MAAESAGPLDPMTILPLNTRTLHIRRPAVLKQSMDILNHGTAAMLPADPSLALTQVRKMMPFQREEKLDRFLNILGKAELPN